METAWDKPNTGEPPCGTDHLEQLLVVDGARVASLESQVKL